MKKVKKAKRQRVNIDGEWYSLKSNGKPGVKLTRNDGWMTESAFFGMIRSALRLSTKYWKPKLRYLEEHSRPYVGLNKRIKKEYQCEHCNEWFVRAKVECNHKNPCGSLQTYEDLVSFVKRLYIEYDGGWELLCLVCHNIVTNKERKIDTTKEG